LAQNSEISRATESSIGDMTENLRIMIDEFSSSSALCKSILEQAALSSTLLSKDLDSMAGNVRDNRIVGETVERIERLLASIGREAREIAPEFVLSEVERRLEEMNERYTMHAERDTHAAYLGGNTGGPDTSDSATGSVELF
jgi:hypothetical protein